MLREIISLVINGFFRLFPINKRKIVFQSTRYQVTDNPYYIYKYIKENNLNYRLVFIVDKNADTECLAKGDYAYVRSLKAYYHLATYKYLFTCQSLGSILKKRKNQTYIQLWHSISLKKMGLDVSDEDNITQLVHTKDWDFVVSSGKFECSVLKTSSGYTCDTKLLGNPRTDALFYDYDSDKIRQSLGITSNRKIILYAPTFRDWEMEKDVIDINLPPFAKENFTILVRLHPLISEKINNKIFSDNIINACNYNLSELLAVSDFLITDYSSIFFDFSLLGKLSVFYAYDYDKYVRCRNGFYLDYKNELPGPVAYSEQELENILINLDENIYKYTKALPEFNKEYSTFNDGNASKRIVEELLNGGFEK